MGFFASLKISQKISKMPTQRFLSDKGGTFSDDSTRLAPRDARVSFRFTPSREGCARSKTRPLDETARFPARRVRERPARCDGDRFARVFGRNSSPWNVTLFSVQKVQFRTHKQKKHNRSHKRAGRFSLPNVFFVARPKKHAKKLSYFFESALESARRPSFSSSREGGFFGRQKCRVTSDDEVNSSLEESGVFLRKGSKIIRFV